jgi:hypothetical protein
LDLSLSFGFGIVGSIRGVSLPFSYFRSIRTVSFFLRAKRKLNSCIIIMSLSLYRVVLHVTLSRTNDDGQYTQLTQEKLIQYVNTPNKQLLWYSSLSLSSPPPLCRYTKEKYLSHTVEKKKKTVGSHFRFWKGDFGAPVDLSHMRVFF